MEHLLTVLIIINLILNIAFLAVFELKKPSVREFLPLTVVCAAAALGRVIFSFIPQIQPVTVLVIITGSAYGSLYGYVTGSLCALISNMMLGQGPWTLFQMSAWGIVGFIAGMLGHLFKNKNTKGSIGIFELLVFCVYGFFSAVLYSIVVDTLSVSYLGESVTFLYAITVFATGIIFNAGHAVFNAVLIILIYRPVKRSLLRCRRI